MNSGILNPAFMRSKLILLKNLCRIGDRHSAVVTGRLNVQMFKCLNILIKAE